MQPYVFNENEQEYDAHTHILPPPIFFPPPFFIRPFFPLFPFLPGPFPIPYAHQEGILEYDEEESSL